MGIILKLIQTDQVKSLCIWSNDMFIKNKFECFGADQWRPRQIPKKNIPIKQWLPIFFSKYMYNKIKIKEIKLHEIKIFLALPRTSLKQLLKFLKIHPRRKNGCCIFLLKLTYNCLFWGAQGMDVLNEQKPVYHPTAVVDMLEVCHCNILSFFPQWKKFSKLNKGMFNTLYFRKKM